MKVDYKKNLNIILSYSPHIYYNMSELPNNIDTFAVLHNQFTDMSTYKLINVFRMHIGNIEFIDYLAVDISLDELTVHIDQLKRDDKLKEVLKIINE